MIDDIDNGVDNQDSDDDANDGGDEYAEDDEC